MQAIMINTPYDPELRFRNASGNIAVDMLAPPDSDNPGMVGVYVRRGNSPFNIGDNISYANGSTVITGPVKKVIDLTGQSFLVYLIPYSGSSITAPLSGGSVSLSNLAPGSSDGGASSSVAAIGSKITQAAKTYWPFIAIAGALGIGLMIWKFKKNKK